MKKCVSIILAAILLFSCIYVGTPEVYAAKKPEKTRAIAIVFDNSGTMYIGDEDSRKTWCRATYAMQALATMMNPSDVMQIYPMNPIQIGNSDNPKDSDVYTRERPLVVKKENASQIQEIFTPRAGDTHIEAVTLAREGLAKTNADEKWLIVLTDGTVFYRNGIELSVQESIRQLTEEFNQSVSQVNAMYLGIGKEAQSGFAVKGTYQFIERKATNSAQVLANLTELGNIIFGRDAMPSVSETITFDVSMKKLIVFIQGESIDNVVLGNLKPVSTDKLKYSTYGAKNYAGRFLCDTSLQGTMLTFENLDAGTYQMSFSGQASDIAVYYEPDADLDFVFTDAAGNTVDPKALYEGDYKVSFGMKDAKTGKLISSKLLGNPSYQGSYFIDGKEYPIISEGFSGSVDIPLKMGETFKANLTATYLSGYTISKDSSDFGWPDIGITIAAPPAGQLVFEIAGGDEVYYLRELENGTPYTITAYYEGEQLQADEYKLNFTENSGNAIFLASPDGDHYKVMIQHSEPANPENTKVGSFEVTANISYAAKGSEEAKARATVSYRIDAARPAGDLRLEISGGDALYHLQDLEKGSSYIAKVYYQGIQLTGSDLEKVDLKWLPETSNAEIKKEFAGDHWKLNLHYKDPAEPQNTVCGECTVTILALYTAEGCSEAQAQSPLTYNIKDDFSPLQIELVVPESYIVIKDLEASKEIVVNLRLNSTKLSAEDFVNTKLQVDCGGIKYTLTPNEQDSSYLIKLLPTDGIGEGSYPINITASYTDHIGRETQTEDSVRITLSNTPLWVKWLIGLLLLLLLFLIIWAIMHIKVLPTKAHTTRKLSNLNFDGEDVTKSTSFLAEIKKDGARMQTQYGGRKFGLIMDVTPGQESYLYKPHKGRSAEVKPVSVRKFGPAKIQEALIGTAKYTIDDETGKLVPALPNQKPFPLKNGATVRYSGTISDAGIDKDFEVLSKISFNKK